MDGVNQRIDFDKGFLVIRFPFVWSGQAIGDAVGMGSLSPPLSLTGILIRFSVFVLVL